MTDLHEYPGGNAPIQFKPKSSNEHDKTAGKNTSKAAKPFVRDETDARPVIKLSAAKWNDVMKQAEQAMLNSRKNGQGEILLFQQGNQLVTIVRGITHKTLYKRPAEASSIVQVSSAWIRQKMAQSALFIKLDRRDKEWIPARVPADLATEYLGMVGEWRVPRLEGIVNAPTIRPDGSLIIEPGYDEATGLYFDPRGVEFLPIPENPTKADAKAAVERLKKLVGTFRFAEQDHEELADGGDHGEKSGGNPYCSVWLAAVLTGLIRKSLDTAPGFAFSAPTPGSGKGKLADMIAVIASGHKSTLVGFTDKEDEMEKRLVAVLIGGDQAVNIDNVDAPLYGAFLCSLLTRDVVSGRPLGKSEMRALNAKTTMLSTGNNWTCRADMSRRWLICKIDPGVERPEDRDFDFDPVTRTEEKRLDAIRDALTIVLAFVKAGSPKQDCSNLSYVDWSRFVQQPLIWLDEPDPAKTAEDIRDEDAGAELPTEIFNHWFELFGDEMKSANDVIAALGEMVTADNDNDYRASYGPPQYEHTEFRSLVLEVSADSKDRSAISARSFGKWLSKHKNRIYGGKQLRQRKQSSNSKKPGQWYVHSIPEP